VRRSDLDLGAPLWSELANRRRFGIRISANLFGAVKPFGVRRRIDAALDLGTRDASRDR
jgi:hypothetical protein